MEANRDNQPRSEPRDQEDDAWTPADPDPRDSFDETLPADRADWEAAADRRRQTSTPTDE
ncbi:MAG TPA: hypothetical protein VFU81_22315 [Thermomicrobiales bacterium]|nr:hypothetical protein [Thermomicrobiales bacterium]